MAQYKGKIKSLLLIIIGAILVVYALILHITMNGDMGVICILAFGILMVGAGVFYKKLKEYNDTKFFKAYNILWVVILCVELVVGSFVAIYGYSDNVDYNEDAVIVLGSSIKDEKTSPPLKMRLDKAIEYHRKNPGAVIVVTGGPEAGTTVTQAYVMEKYLVENGVNGNIILKEEKSSSTAENMKFTKEILDDYFPGDYKVAVITNHFHIFRGTVLAQHNGFTKVSHLHAELPWYNVMPCFIRESLAILKGIMINGFAPFYAELVPNTR